MRVTFAVRSVGANNRAGQNRGLVRLEQRAHCILAGRTAIYFGTYGDRNMSTGCNPKRTSHFGNGNGNGTGVPCLQWACMGAVRGVHRSFHHLTRCTSMKGFHTAEQRPCSRQALGCMQNCGQTLVDRTRINTRLHVINILYQIIPQSIMLQVWDRPRPCYMSPRPHTDSDCT